MSIYVQCVEKSTKSANRKQESDGSKNASHDMGCLYEACDQISDLCHQQLLRKMCIYVQCVQKPTKSANRKQESDGSKNATHNMVYLYDACDQISDFYHQQLLRKMRRKISWTDRGKTVYPPPPSGSGGIKNFLLMFPLSFVKIIHQWK